MVVTASTTTPSRGMRAASTSGSAPPPADTRASTSSSGPPSPPPPHPLPPTARNQRRRVREVSSRYLSAPIQVTTRRPTPSPRLSSSFSSCCSMPSPRTQHRPTTPFANENHPPTPSAAASSSSSKRAVVNLFDEMLVPTHHRPCPPTPFAGGVYSATSTAVTPKTNRSSSGSAIAVQRRGYLRQSTLACPSFDFSDASSQTWTKAIDFSDSVGIGDVDFVSATCDTPTLISPSYVRGRASCNELRSSLPEISGSGRASSPVYHRSLNSALRNCPGLLGKGKVAWAKPPQPPGGLKAIEVKNVGGMMGGNIKKASVRQEDAHQLRMMDNCYLQYRLLNAQAEGAAKAKIATAEKSLYMQSKRITDLRDSVAEKKAKLECLKKVERMCSTVGGQVHYLEQWSNLDGDHSSCLTRATTALYDASLRLPITGNIRVNIGKITEVLNSAMQMLEPLSPCIENVLPKVGEIDDVAYNLAKVVGIEKLLIEQCGNLLCQAHDMQMRECSLRCQLMQQKQESNMKMEYR
ncbi:hypothetical protein GUJ93_ZPchr0010g9179 [Zizania palustris]|uniref:Uncharacterized protein n=1 Tax=Zizania palustris TaxID=103762 RepID=A0A8J5WF19_ZIZPA|nr:hypothetical protein GUJ93_ZPchr0010g9179 [Zizania palustris]